MTLADGLVEPSSGTALQGKVALVTGAGKGIGRAIAVEYAAEGGSVVAASRSLEPLKDVIGKIEVSGGAVVALECDVTRREDLERAVKTAVQSFGGLHILVNNAGGAVEMAPLEDLRAELWDQIFRANVRSAFLAMQLAFPYLKSAQGTIINMGSMSGQHGHQHMAAYAAAKEAILGLSRSAAKEWGRYGINVNVINPAVESDGVRRSYTADPGRQAQLTEHTALKWFAGPREVARAAVFLGSDDARYITGVKLDVDGGRAIMHAMDAL